MSGSGRRVPDRNQESLSLTNDGERGQDTREETSREKYVLLWLVPLSLLVFHITNWSPAPAIKKLLKVLPFTFLVGCTYVYVYVYVLRF